MKRVPDGPSQGLLDIPAKPEPPAQSEMLVCQICGLTWMTDNAKTVHLAWKQHNVGIRGPLCDTCWQIWSISRTAQARKMSLKEVVEKYLRGRSKQLHRPMEKIWKEK